MAKHVGLKVIVEIDENERYWVGKGFGKGGLLPNDRGAFTTTDGSLYWKTTKEASEDLLLLGRGWVYSDQEEDFYPTRRDRPEDCWLYATDFRPDHIQQAKPYRGNLQWIRFRKLVRTKVFHPEEFVPKEIYEKCDHCDSVETEALSSLLLDVLAYASLLHNKSQITDAVLLPLKRTVVDLAIDQTVDKTLEAKEQLAWLYKKLAFFLEKERSKTSMSRLLTNRVEFPFAARKDKKDFQSRWLLVEARCLPKSECDAIAGLIVRKLDPRYELHCDKVNCGPECQFARVECPNKGCNKSMSRIHMEAHDAKCDFKIVHCECGETMKNYEMGAHLKKECKLREVDCPFKVMGCSAEVKACNLEQHVADNTTSHLMLAASRMQQQQQEITRLRTSLETTISEKNALSQSYETHKANATKEIIDLRTTVTTLSKDLEQLQKTCKNQFKHLNAAQQKLR